LKDYIMNMDNGSHVTVKLTPASYMPADAVTRRSTVKLTLKNATAVANFSCGDGTISDLKKTARSIARRSHENLLGWSQEEARRANAIDDLSEMIFSLLEHDGRYNIKGQIYGYDVEITTFLSGSKPFYTVDDVIDVAMLDSVKSARLEAEEETPALEETPATLPLVKAPAAPAGYDTPAASEEAPRAPFNANGVKMLEAMAAVYEEASEEAPEGVVKALEAARQDMAAEAVEEAPAAPATRREALAALRVHGAQLEARYNAAQAVATNFDAANDIDPGCMDSFYSYRGMRSALMMSLAEFDEIDGAEASAHAAQAVAHIIASTPLEGPAVEDISAAPLHYSRPRVLINLATSEIKSAEEIDTLTNESDDPRAFIRATVAARPVQPVPTVAELNALLTGVYAFDCNDDPRAPRVLTNLATSEIKSADKDAELIAATAKAKAKLDEANRVALEYMKTGKLPAGINNRHDIPAAERDALDAYKAAKAHELANISDAEKEARAAEQEASRERSARAAAHRAAGMGYRASLEAVEAEDAAAAAPRVLTNLATSEIKCAEETDIASVRITLETSGSSRKRQHSVNVEGANLASVNYGDFGKIMDSVITEAMAGMRVAKAMRPTIVQAAYKVRNQGHAANASAEFESYYNSHKATLVTVEFLAASGALFEGAPDDREVTPTWRKLGGFGSINDRRYFQRCNAAFDKVATEGQKFDAKTLGYGDARGYINPDQLQHKERTNSIEDIRPITLDDLTVGAQVEWQADHNGNTGSGTIEEVNEKFKQAWVRLDKGGFDIIKFRLMTKATPAKELAAV
jgi:hypothetical protein